MKFKFETVARTRLLGLMYLSMSTCTASSETSSGVYFKKKW